MRRGAGYVFHRQRRVSNREWLRGAGASDGSLSIIVAHGEKRR
jgi:hypothetical protein